MKQKEIDYRIKELDFKLQKVKHSLEGLIPIWSQVDRKINSLRHEMKMLEDEKASLLQGQLRLDLDF
jgi:phage shock protein A